MQKIIGLAGLARSGKDTAASILLSYPNVDAIALADPLKLGCQALFGLTGPETWDDNQKETRIALWDRSPRQLFQEVGTEWMRSYNSNFWLARVTRMLQYSNSRFPPLSANPLESRIEVKLACQAFFLFTDEQLTHPVMIREVDPYWKITPEDAFNLIERHTLASFPNWHTQRPHAAPPSIQQGTQIDDTNYLIIKDIRFENEASYIRDKQGEIWHIKRRDCLLVNPHSSELGINVHTSDTVIGNDGTILDLEQSLRRSWTALHTRQLDS